MMRKKPILLFALSALLFLTGCGNVEKEAKYPSGADRASTGDDIYAKPQSIFGGDGLKIGRSGDKDNAGSGIGVNSYLWRATLDTVSFMPLASADPFGGVILTDWYAPPSSPRERLKINAFIMGRELRSDAIQVKVFRQVKSGGDWQDSSVAENTESKLEDAILTRARQIRVQQMSR